MLKITTILAMIAIITSAIRLDTDAKNYCDKNETSHHLSNLDCLEVHVRVLRVNKTGSLASWKTWDKNTTALRSELNAAK